MLKIEMNHKYYYNTVFSVLDELDDYVIGHPRSAEDLCLIIEHHLFKVFDPKDFNLSELEFYVYAKFDDSAPFPTVVGGYGSLDEWTTKSEIEDVITLELYFSRFEKTQTVCMSSRNGWNITKREIGKVLFHELIHVSQSRKRCGMMPVSLAGDEMADYLRDCDEIQAYAYDAAVEMLDSKVPVTETETAKLYMEHFKFEPIVKQRFYKHVFKALQVLGD